MAAPHFLPPFPVFGCLSLAARIFYHRHRQSPSRAPSSSTHPSPGRSRSVVAAAMSALLTPRMTDCSSVSDDVTDQSASAHGLLRPPSSPPPPSVVVIQLRTLFSPSGVELSRSTPPSLSPLTYASVCPRPVRPSVDVSKKRHFVFCLDRCFAASPISPVPLSLRRPPLPSPRPNPFLPLLSPPLSFAFEMKNVRIFWPTMIPLTMPSESVRRARRDILLLDSVSPSVVCISQEIKVQHRNPPSSFSHSPPSSLPISPSHRCESPSPHCNSVAGTSASVASPFPSMATIRQNGSGDRLGESGSKDKGGWRRLAESHLAPILSGGPLAT